MNSSFPCCHFMHFENTAEAEVGSICMFGWQVPQACLVCITNTTEICETFAIKLREDWIKEERQREVKKKL